VDCAEYQGLVAVPRRPLPWRMLARAAPLRSRRRALAAAAVLSAGVASWLMPAAASALPSFTWTGEGSNISGSGQWSEPNDWQAKSAPSGAAETLIFPRLSSEACAGPIPIDPCYFTENDLSSLTTNTITIEDDAERLAYEGFVGAYRLTGNSLTLGAGGLTETAAPAHEAIAVLELPLILAAPQTWSLTDAALITRGSTSAQDGDVSGQSSALAINLSHGSELDVGPFKSIETGDVTITGGDPAASGVNAPLNGEVSLRSLGGPDSLNGNDGNTFQLTDAALGSFGGRVGPLTVTGGDVAVEVGLTVAGNLTFDAASVLEMDIYGTLSSELRATGTVDLNTAQLLLNDVGQAMGPQGCYPQLSGVTYTLISTTGAVKGTFAGLPDGSTVELTCQYPEASPEAPGITPTVVLHYTEKTVTATVASVGVTPAQEIAARKQAAEETAAKNKAAEETAKKTAEAAAAKKKAGESAASEATKRKAAEEALLLGRISASLNSHLTPAAKGAKRTALLKTGGFTFAFVATSPGTLAISWFEVPKGARLAAHAQPVLVATASARFTTASTRKVTIKLTSKGKRLLKHNRQLKLVAEATFTPPSASAIVVTRPFVLKS
jgi:hypothetical protein